MLNKMPRDLLKVSLILVVVAALSVNLVGCGGKKEVWPTKDLSCIIPAVPGGVSDLQARLLAPYLQQELPGNPSIVMQNISGAGQVDGTLAMLRAAPDGYTIGCFGVEVMAFLYVMGDIDVDPRELDWLGQVSLDQIVLATNSEGKFPSLKDMADQEVRWGVTAQMIPMAAVINRDLKSIFRPVMYDGIADCSLALMRGDVDVVIASWPRMMSQIDISEGKLTATCSITKDRIPQIPEVPTIAETGIDVSDSTYAVSVMRAFVAPKGLPKDIHDALVKALQTVVSKPNVLEEAVKAKCPITVGDAKAVQDYIDMAIKAYEGVKDILLDVTKK